MSDKEILDWLQEQIVDVIYLDDGRIIDVRGLNVRKAVEARASEQDVPQREARG